MKKYAMTISIFLLAGPALFLMGDGTGTTVQIAFVGLIVLWGVLELWISISRPFKGIAPSDNRIRISRMLWLVFVIYSWADFRTGMTVIGLSSRVLITLAISYIFALLLRLYSVVHLGPSFSYDVQVPESGSFISTGPYGLIRHPSYLSICILGSLPGLALGSVVGFTGMALTTVLVVILRVAYEDALLERHFGQSFRRYRQKTYRLIPYLY